jgi:hypothetical protein
VLHSAPGAPLARPQWADALEAPSGARDALSGETIRAPLRAGTYFLTRGTRRAGAVVVDPEPRESVLDRWSPTELAARLRARQTVRAATPGEWADLSFRTATRRPLVGPLLVLAVLALAAEGLVAGAGGTRRAA